MVVRALVAALFLIVSSLPSGACCALRSAEATAVDHAHHGAPAPSKAVGHPAPAFVCVSFCAEAPASVTLTAPPVASAIEPERAVSASPESADVGPAPRPPRAS